MMSLESCGDSHLLPLGRQLFILLQSGLQPCLGNLKDCQLWAGQSYLILQVKLLETESTSFLDRLPTV